MGLSCKTPKLASGKIEKFPVTLPLSFIACRISGVTSASISGAGITPRLFVSREIGDMGWPRTAGLQLPKVVTNPQSIITIVSWTGNHWKPPLQNLSAHHDREDGGFTGCTCCHWGSIPQPEGSCKSGLSFFLRKLLCTHFTLRKAGFFRFAAVEALRLAFAKMAPADFLEMPSLRAILFWTLLKLICKRF